MKQTWLVAFAVLTAATLGAQTASHSAAKSAAHKTAPAQAKSAIVSDMPALPAGVPPSTAPLKSAFTLRYQDIKLGTGADAEPNKLYKVYYSVWIAADGRLLDSTDAHRDEVKGPDGKTVMGDDGKPKMTDPEPFAFVQGKTHLIPGFAQAFWGMKAGGKRRLFIPWQLAYGAEGQKGGDPSDPGVPPKADLIFDVELISVEDAPTDPEHAMVAPDAQAGAADSSAQAAQR